MRTALVLGAMLSAALCSPAFAQKTPDIGGRQVRQVSVSTDIAYDSNIAHTNETLTNLRTVVPEDYTVRPRANFQIVQLVGAEAVFLTGSAGYDFHRYNKQLDNINTSVQGGGVIALASCRSTLFGGYDGRQSDPEEVPGSNGKNLLTTINTGLGVTCGRGIGLGESLSYRHTKAYNSAPTREQSNHSSDSVSLAVTYGNQTLGSLGLVASYATQNYPNQLTLIGSGNTFQVTSFGVTYSRLFGAKLKGSVSVSDAFLTRDFAPPGVPSRTSGLNYDMSADYQFNSRLDLQLQATRAYQPSNRPGKLYDLLTGVQADAKYKLGSRIVLGLGGTYRDVVSNTDNTITSLLVPSHYKEAAGFGSVSYRQNKRVSLTLEVRQQEKTADIATFNYSDTRATLTVDVSLHD